MPVQLSLLDSLTYYGTVALPALVGRVRRLHLDDTAWVDVVPNWIPGEAEIFSHLIETVPWVAEHRKMYERTVTVPRLLAFYDEDAELPHPALTRIRAELNRYYQAELDEPLRTAGLCWYRDGRDSVAWHGDRVGRGSTHDTMVAIVSLGSDRQLALRPVGGTLQHRLSLGHGDLAVMGGSCQRTWDHAILKTARPVGPRVSVQFRPRGVR